jgi:hypothetical protein
MTETTTLSNFKKHLDLQTDLSVNLALVQGNLKFLAEQSNSKSWKGSITEGCAILEALNQVQLAIKAKDEMREMNLKKKTIIQ